MATTWPTLPQVRAWLRLQPNDAEDLVIDQARLAAIDYGMGRTGNVWDVDAVTVPYAVAMAATMDASRIYRRRDSIDGTIQWSDGGAVRIGRADADVERLYAGYAPVVFG
jgi:hypothetical protein